MEPITLITTAISLATPYLIRSGEKIAEGIGEDIWNLIKKPFTKDESFLSLDIRNKEEKEKLINLLIEEVKANSSFKKELETVVSKEELNGNYQQNINNNGNIEKQINIQSNSGNIQM